MKVNVLNLVEGYLDDIHGQHAPAELQRNGVPFVSFPIEFIDLPKETKAIALTFVDHDAIPVVGCSWIHWLAANISPEIKILAENASEENKVAFLQGSNSWNSVIAKMEDIKITQQYGGPTPPDQDHDYTLVVYALDKELELKNGYYLNEFYKVAKDHILEEVEVIVKYKK